MLELLENAISAPNVFLTFMLGLVLLYWLSVILGALDIKSLDADFHVHKEIPILHKDIPSKDLHIDGGGGGFFFGLLRFFNFGALPFMVVISILFLSMWSISMLTNHPGSLVNPFNAYWLACLYSIPNLIVSLFITKLLTQPLVPFFKKLDSGAKPIDFTGKTGVLTLPLAGQQVGQARLMIDNSDVLIRVKSGDGAELKKGDSILVIEELPDEKCFIVQKIDK